MQALETVNPAKGTRRFYLDGRRVTRAAFYDAKEGATLDCFLTTERRGVTRHYVSIRTQTKG